jgi:rod shape-determining protein MreC
MENFFSRYKNPLVLMAVLFIQVIALATQVKRQENPKLAGTPGETRLIRVWTIDAATPFEHAFVSTGKFFRNAWHNYLDLHGVRQQNVDLQQEVATLKLEQVRLQQEADQAHRLQTLLGFKEHYIEQTLPAQVIGGSGSEQSRVILIDKGVRDGVKPDMAVITPDGIVGKVKDAFRSSSQVLLINDHDSGAGVILEKSRLQGVLKGVGQGLLSVSDIMSDETVEAGEQVITSGGDHIYPKGLPVGTVSKVAPDHENDPFLTIRVKPAADLNRLEEVLVVTRISNPADLTSEASTPQRAADILAARLPSVPESGTNTEKKTGKAAKPAVPGASKPQQSTTKVKTTGSQPAAKPLPETKLPAAKPQTSSAANGVSPSASKPAGQQPSQLTPKHSELGAPSQVKGTAAQPQTPRVNPAASPIRAPKSSPGPAISPEKPPR